jgi:hypothetical protein
MPSKINPVTAIVVSRMKPKRGNGILAFFIVSVVRGGAGWIKSGISYASAAS